MRGAKPYTTCVFSVLFNGIAPFSFNLLPGVWCVISVLLSGVSWLFFYAFPVYRNESDSALGILFPPIPWLAFIIPRFYAFVNSIFTFLEEKMYDKHKEMLRNMTYCE